jgi:hypothetical protein
MTGALARITYMVSEFDGRLNNCRPPEMLKIHLYEEERRSFRAPAPAVLGS